MIENRDVIGEIDPQKFAYSCHLSARYPYIYYATPKTGCSTIKLTLQRAELEDDTFVPPDFEELHVRETSPLLMPTQVHSFRRLLGSPEYLKFCFVRNPFTRVLSCYLDKIDRGRSQKAIILRQLGRSPEEPSTSITFEEFLDAVAAQPVTAMDDHWCVQWFHTAQGRFPYDVVSRYESFDRDLARIAERLGIDLDRYYSRERRNETGAERLLGRYYDRRLVELVRRIYAADFSGFGYSLELPQ
jgi:Sulfotransferase family